MSDHPKPARPGQAPTRREYQAPQVARVELESEQVLGTNCKVSGGAGSQYMGQCSDGFSLCLSSS